jgi:hypothetical protein
MLTEIPRRSSCCYDFLAYSTNGGEDRANRVEDVQFWGCSGFLCGFCHTETLSTCLCEVELLTKRDLSRDDLLTILQYARVEFVSAEQRESLAQWKNGMEDIIVKVVTPIAPRTSPR